MYGIIDFRRIFLGFIKLHGYDVVEAAFLPVHYALLECVEGFGESHRRGFKPQRLKGRHHERILRSADLYALGVGKLADRVLGVGGQLAVADIHNGQNAGSAFLDRSFVVLIPHGVDKSPELFKGIKKVGHIQPAAGRREGRVVVGRQHGHLNGP